MIEVPKDGQQPEDDPIQIAQTLLEKQKKANEMLAQLNSYEEYALGMFGRKVKVFHEAYVVGKVEPYCPKDRGGKHMGWVIYSVNPTIFEHEGGTFKQVEAVSFDEIDNIVPETGDLAHVRRENSWAGPRLSIKIIKDMPTEEEKQVMVGEVDSFVKKLFDRPKDQ